MVEPQPSKLMVRVRFPSSALKKEPRFSGAPFVLPRILDQRIARPRCALERRGINDEAVAHFRGHNFVVGLGNGITVDDLNHGTHAVLGAEL